MDSWRMWLFLAPIALAPFVTFFIFWFDRRNGHRKGPQGSYVIPIVFSPLAGFCFAIALMFALNLLRYLLYFVAGITGMLIKLLNLLLGSPT